MKKIVILGATGSIGTSALDIIRRFPHHFELIGLTAKSNGLKLEQIAREFEPKLVALQDEKAAQALDIRLSATKVEVLAGQEGIVSVACLAEADLVISAIVGAAGLLPTLSAIQAGKTVALANKEPLVMAGEIIQKAASRRGVSILPIDSEHSAIFQVLVGEKYTQIKRVILTASGGPLLGMSPEMKRSISPKQALAHPNWKMGPKISIDSATLMNKGLEVIEAQWLFGLSSDKIDVVIHPQSIIHSMVEFHDRSVVAQMGLPDMRVPIAYVLHYPDRASLPFPSLDLTEIGTLSFEEPDRAAFPLLSTAYDVLKEGGTLPSVLNAANEVAVAAFLKEDIAFGQIEVVIQETLSAHSTCPAETLEDVIEADRWARTQAQAQVRQVQRL